MESVAEADWLKALADGWRALKTWMAWFLVIVYIGFLGLGLDLVIFLVLSLVGRFR